MKQFILSTLLLFVYLCDAKCQIHTRYYPDGNVFEDVEYLSQIPREKSLYRMPSFNVEQLLEEDIEKTKEGNMPTRFGKSFETNYTLSDGMWYNVEGGRVWTISFESEGAISINFAFTNFRLPKGANLYIANKDKTMMYGPVTSDLIPSDETLLTEIIKGDCVSIYLYEPVDKKGQSNLTIKEVVHGYRNLFGRDILSKSTNDSDCFIDVACVDYWDIESDAVASVTVDASHGCSGALLMTANNSFIPYFLTAYHAMENTNFNNWSFTFFNKKKTCTSTSYIFSTQYIGATFRAGWDKTDFLLLELTADLSNNQKIAWLGWDRSTSTPVGGACIGLPGTLPMKISIDNDTFSSYNYNSDASRYWKNGWDYGVIEHGMSGGPLFNQAKRVVGQMRAILNGNGNVCDNVNTISGKFNYSWTGNGTNSTRLSNWLDPTGIGSTFTLTKRLHNPTISGPDIICPGVTSTYTINDLDTSMTVQWLFDPNYNGADLPSFNPSGGSCTVTNDCLKSWAGTLTASIKWQGETITVLRKKIICYSSFYATYSNGAIQNQEIILGSPVWVTKGQTVYFRSANLINKDISFSVTTPSSVNYYSEDGNLNFIYPNISSNNPIFVNIQKIDNTSCEQDNYQIIVLPNNLLPSYKLYAKFVNNQILISLIPIESEEYQDDYKELDNIMWNLEIFQLSTGQKIYSAKHFGRECSLDTIGWKPDFYLIQITIGDEVLTEKIVVK